MNSSGRLASFKQKKVFSNSIYLAASTIMTRLYLLILTILIARSLGKEKFGEYTFIVSLLAVVQPITVFGADMYIPKEIAKNEEYVVQNLTSFFLVQEILAVVVTLFSVLFNIYSTGILGKLIAFLPAVFLFGPLGSLNAVFLGRESGKRIFQLQNLLFGSNLLLSIVVLTFMPTIKMLGIAYSLSYVLTFILALRWMMKVVNLHWPIASPMRLLKGLFPYAMVSFLSVFKSRIGIILLPHFLSYEQVGIYGAAQRLFDGLRVLVSYPYPTAVYPRIASLISRGHKPRQVYAKFFKIGVLGAAFMTAVLFLLADILVRLLYSSNYAQATILLRILSLSILLDMANSLNGKMLFILNKPGIISVAIFVSAAVSWVTNLILIGRLGITGAAWATDCAFISYAVCLQLSLFINFRRQKV